MNTDIKLLSVILLVKNLEKEIINRLSGIKLTLDNLCCDYEIKLIDNNSNDQTLDKLREATTTNAIKNLQVLALHTEMSAYQALWVGIENALGDHVLTIDLNEEDIDLLPMVLQKSDKNNDIVFAINESRLKSQRLTYRFLFFYFRFLYGLINGIELNKDTSLYRLISRRVVNHLEKYSNPDVKFRALSLNSRFSSSVIHYSYKQNNPPKKPIKHCLMSGLRLFLFSNYRPMRIVTLFTLFGSFINLAYAIYVITVWLFKSNVEPGWVSLSLQQSGMFFLFSTILFMFGEYLLNSTNLDEKQRNIEVIEDFSSEHRNRHNDLNVRVIKDV